MPTYECICDDCGNPFDVERSIKDENLGSCPHCGSEQVRRLISRSSFSLRGSGWASDGYSRGSASSESPAPKTSGGGGGGLGTKPLS